MSKLNLYAVKDVKATAFYPPFTAKNNAIAIRMFGDSVTNKESIFNHHPEDYQLYYLAEFDEETGDITGKPAFLENASNLLNS